MTSAPRATPKPGGLVLGRATLAPSGVPSWISPRVGQADAGNGVVRRVQSIAAPELNPYAEAGHHRAVSHAEHDATSETVSPQMLAPRSEGEPPAVQVPPAPVLPTMHEVSEPPDAPELAALRGENHRLRAQLAAAPAAAGMRAEAMRDAEMELVRLAVALAERVIARELRTDRALVARWAREALDALQAEGAPVADAVVALGAETALVTPPDAWAALDGRARVTQDPRLPPGGCEVRAGSAAVDASAGGRWESVRSDVLGAEEP